MLYLTLRQLEYVSAVARAGSLVAAAEQLHVSQPALSAALARVEEHLGRALFIRRKGSPVQLTPAGEIYTAQVEELLSRARRLEDRAAFAEATAGRLTIGIFDDLAPFYLAPLRAALARALPEVELHSRIADFETLAREMLDGRIDLALTWDLGLDGSFTRTPLFAVAPVAFMAPNDPLALRSSVPLEALRECPLILFEEGLSVRHVLGLFRRFGARPLVRHRVRALEVMRSLAARQEGIGISYASPPARQSYDGAPVVAVPISDDYARESVVLVQSALAQETPLVSEAAAVVREALR